MPKTLIEQFPKETRVARDDSMSLNIAELFCDTVQGEGINSGIPATFIRLQGCTLVCVWCDTLEVWKQGNPYSIEEVLDMFEEAGMIPKFKAGQHIVLTGGSPLKQGIELLQFCRRFSARFGFSPHYEVENECVLLPPKELIPFINTWNNSPKLENSGMKSRARYKPDVISTTARFVNSWFKFVISSVDDWNEIQKDYLEPGLIRREQIILMPEGQDQEQVRGSYEATAELAVRENVRMCDRLHITIWNKKTGV